MTIVAALKTPAGMWMGADSLASDDTLRVTSSTPKVVKFPRFLLGFCGAYAGHLISAVDKNLSLKSFISEMRIPREVQLLGMDWSGIYEIDSGKGMVRMKSRASCSYGVVGSGSGVALGALYSNHWDQSSLLMALKAAAEHTNHVRGPFRIMALE